MKPYTETHNFEGVLDAPIDTAWALHTNPDQMRSALSRILDMEVVAGTPGQKGCVTRSVQRDGKGQPRTLDTEIVEVHPPHSITVRVSVRKASRVTYESTRTFERQGNHTPTTLTITATTSPIPWVMRAIIGLGRSKRARETAAEFRTETAEENAYYAHSAP
ncbi:MAG: SRPBCC family protein [Demequinaceae bacterium]|nr:SRPBCC family protein [Demequinaceae bacterium]